MPVRCLLLLGIAPLALSQQPVEILPRIIVNVTGSNIPRTDIETALPIQRIGRDDIDRSGATTAAELLNTVSANLRGQNDATSNGGFFAVPGLASANLRGLGSGSTLVLINGRRTANYAFDGGTVDLNSIPLAAVDRVEILKDGASAIYGADAIAGVINFIMRKDYAGIAVSGYSADTQHGGGNHRNASCEHALRLVRLGLPCRAGCLSSLASVVPCRTGPDVGRPSRSFCRRRPFSRRAFRA